MVVTRLVLTSQPRATTVSAADGEAVPPGLPGRAEDLRRYRQVKGLHSRQRGSGHGMQNKSLTVTIVA
jgi:hypothetical protein